MTTRPSHIRGTTLKDMITSLHSLGFFRLLIIAEVYQRQKWVYPARYEKSSIAVNLPFLCHWKKMLRRQVRIPIRFRFGELISK